ncbi:MAG TPA: sigma 54-interacting transcriptional regulator [Burkholderiales bacterium]|jgi:two-component system, NtrC family, response regulator GlrR|nr:sigma 54-interacting transcriptional regulator [Burkholderiales bacterium]
MSNILLVDDDPDILKLVSLRLSAAGHGVREAESGERALGLLAASRPDLVITDLKMDGIDGLTLFDEIRKQAPTLPVIILTAHGTIPDAVAATRRGVFAFQPKPFDGKHLLEQVEQALKLSGGAQGTEEDWRRDFVTKSPRMENVLHQARLVAQSEASVFLQGASGTGKELLARAIHRASRRSQGPFVAVNCAAIPENLLESELFGHRKGSFTGANYDHKGLIPAADQGTLFLDEIGDMPVALQAKLLRVLQEREVRAVGATQGTPVDVRIISATHRDLDAQMKEGRFREDLYYRLNVVSLDLPQLSDRREDIVPLATHYLKATAARYGKDVQAFAPEALQLLLAAPWPGNVRQLVNVIEQVVALCASSLVPASLVQQALKEEPAQLASLEQARGAFEREYLIRILRITGGSVTQAAKLARRNRTEFYKLLERHRLEPKMFKAEKA